MTITKLVTGQGLIRLVAGDKVHTNIVEPNAKWFNTHGCNPSEFWVNDFNPIDHIGDYVPEKLIDSTELDYSHVVVVNVLPIIWISQGKVYPYIRTDDAPEATACLVDKEGNYWIATDTFFSLGIC